LSDGLGNDSPISMSTTNVGIGTTTPTGKLEVNGTIRSTRIGAASQYVEIDGGDAGGGYLTMNGAAKTLVIKNNSTGSSDVLFDQAVATRYTFAQAGTQILRIDADGIKFGTDSAAANALDDYEEGTFTATLSPSVSGTISLSPSTCSYTKIGRQVTVRGQIVVSAVSSPVGSIIVLGGLPFTSQNAVSSRGTGAFQYFPSIGSGSLVQNYQLQNSIEVNLISTASTIVAGDEFYISLTYFV